MENNNDNNLFTNMFGIESEEPKEQIQPEPTPQPVVENNVMEQPQQPTPIPQPVPEQKTIVEEIITLDSNKPIVEETPIQIEQPSLNTINMNTNYQPVKPIHQQEDLSFDTNNPNNYKSLCIILGITLVVVVLAFPIYIGLNNYFSKNTDNQNNQPSQEETPSIQKQPSQQEPTTPVINFDIDLSFDKGYTNNQKEYHQTVAYKPEQTEGIIKCENIKTAVTSQGQFKNIVYLYYKDLMVKKYIQVTDSKLNNSKTYSELVSSYQAFESLTSSSEHLYTKLLVSNASYRINFYMLVDLAYNQAIRVPEENVYYDVLLSYNMPIKNAMNKYLTDPAVSGNFYCSTLATVDTSL